MGRKNIVSKRIMEILDGKLLRFTAIHSVYKKRYRKAAYKQVADNLKLLQQKGNVSHFAGYYCLTDDLVAGKFEDKKIQLLNERNKTLRKMQEKIGEAAEEDFERRLQTLIKEKNYDKIKEMVEELKTIGYCLAVATTLIISSESLAHARIESEQIMRLASGQSQQVERLKKILEQNKCQKVRVRPDESSLDQFSGGKLC